MVATVADYWADGLVAESVVTKVPSVVVSMEFLWVVLWADL